MFLGLDKYCSKFESNAKLYELFKSAVKDYCETYDVSDLRFDFSCGCGKKAYSIIFFIKSNSIESILGFCDDFNYFLDNTPIYKDLVDLPFECYDLDDRCFTGLTYSASFSYKDPFESETNAPDPEGGEG